MAHQDQDEKRGFWWSVRGFCSVLTWQDALVGAVVLVVIGVVIWVAISFSSL